MHVAGAGSTRSPRGEDRFERNAAGGGSGDSRATALLVVTTAALAAGAAAAALFPPPEPGGGAASPSARPPSLPAPVRAVAVQAAVAAGAAERFARAVVTGVAMSADYRISLYGLDEGSEEYGRAARACHRRGAARLLRMALKSEGLYTKVGQALAALNHVLPAEYCETLQLLNDRGYGRPIEEVVRTVEAELGRPLDEVFEVFDPTPVAAASVSQVHAALAKDTGELLAVKVQYCDMRERFAGDMATMELLCDAATLAHPKFDFGWIIRRARRELEMELDFENEARNAERCARELAHVPGVAVPRVRRDLTSTRVLTAEFVRGCSVNDAAAIRRLGFRPADVARKTIGALAYQIFQSGFVHADPHPGNVKVRPDPGRPGSPQIVLLDHGLYLQMDDAVRLEFCGLWRSIVLRDDAALRAHAAALGVDRPELLASMLFQRPYRTGAAGFGTALTQADLDELQRQATAEMGSVVGVLKQMPYNLTLLMRNINLVRSLNKDLGSPANRYVIMGREAVAGGFRGGGGDGAGRPRPALVTRLRQALSVARFEMVLWREEWRAWLRLAFVRALQLVGRAPADLGTLEEVLHIG